MLAEDFVWEESHIDGENAKTTKLWIKYIRIKTDEEFVVKIMENRLKGLIQSKRDYYSGNGTPEEYQAKPFALKIKSDAGLNKYIEGDADVILAKEKIIIQKQKVEVLGSCMDEIRRRGWAIKSALEHIKYLSGG